MKKLISIFVSSTSDLSDERRALERAFRDDPRLRHFSTYLYEDDIGLKGTPKARIEQEIANSEIFLGMLGAHYGSQLDEQDPRSICEWEFDEARAREDIALLMLLSETGGAIEPAQRRFRDRIEAFGRGVWRKTFDSTQALIREVSEGAIAFLAQYYVADQERRARRQRRVRMLSLGGASVGVALAALTAFTACNEVLDDAAVLGASAAALAIVLAAWLVYLLET